MATAAKIDIQLRAQTAELKKGFHESRQAVDRLGKGMSGSVASGMMKFNVALLGVQTALATVSGAVRTLMGAFSEMDATAKTAARLDITADSLTALGFAAEQSGSSQEKMNQSLTQLANRVSDAAQGIGDGKKALDELGLSASALAGMGVDQQMSIISDAMQGVESQSDKVRIAMDLFGRSGTEMLNVMEGGSEGLNAFAAEADSLGLSLGTNREEAEKVQDSINRMKRAWGALVGKIAIAVAPALESIANVLSEIVAAFNHLFSSSGKGEVKFTSLAAAGSKVRQSFDAAEKSVAKTTEKVVKATKKTVDLAKELAGVRVEKTPSISAVTRGSAAGFSAVQQAKRDSDAADRRHKEQVAVLNKILAAVERGDVVLAPMEI